ncbi:PREDICTED: trichohyalin-like [Prunus mume]|uniref:Trichohyalin-like n=1 Tax=Prunus mume TaxID=102107 RepID=A0ABM1LY43_PRUMU|nr:PREDICTED: trichohyalin-like [Prunus mume]
MKKLTSLDPSKTLTPGHMNGIKQCLSVFYPVFRSPDHPTYAVMIQRAIAELNKEGGSTQEAISKFIRERFDCLPLAHESFLSHHLKKLSESGEILSASNNCYMLPAEENGYVSRRERVQKKESSGLGRGRRTRNGIEHKKLAEEQVEVTEHREQRQQSQEPEVIVDQNGCSEQQNEQQDEVNGEVAMVVAKQKYKATKEQFEITEHREWTQQSQEPELIVDQNGCSEQQNEQHDEVRGEVAMVVVKQKYKATEEQVEVTEQQKEQGKQSQELGLQEQHSKVIDDHSGPPEEQQDEVNGQKTEKQMQEVAVIVEKQHNSEEKYKATEEQVELIEQRQHGQNCLETNQGQDELIGQQSQTEMQDVVMIVEKQNNEKEKYKVTEEQVEMTEQRLHGQQSQELNLREQHSKLIDGERGSPDKQHDEVNGQQSINQMEKGTVIVEKQNNSEQKYKPVEEQVEVTEQQREHRQQSQELSLEEQLNMVIDIQNGSPEKPNEHADGSPEKQNEHADEANGQQIQKQMQENAVNFRNRSNAEQKYKVTEENIQAQRDELIEEQCQSEEQQCEVTREQLQIEGIEREIQLLEEQVEIIEKMTTPGEHIEMISEQNKPQEQSELISKIVGSRNMQELLSKKQEKDAATAINSSPSLTSQKLPHHDSSFLSEENCVELLMRTRKLEEKLLENLSSIREGSNHSSQKPSTDLVELFSKHGKLAAHDSQPQMPKCQNKSINTCPHVELPQQKEIGNVERSLKLLTMEAENIREISRHVGKKTCLNFEAEHEKEKHSATCDPNLCCQQKPSVSLQVASCEDVPKHSPDQELERKLKNQQPELQKPQRPELQKPQRPQDVELLSVEGGYKAHESELNIMDSSVDLLQASQHQKRQLRPRHKKTSESGCGVPKARKCQELENEKQPREEIQDMGMKLDHFAGKLSFQAQKKTQEPAQQRQLRPRRQRQSKSEESITASMVESPPTRHQDTLISNLQEAEKPQELKTSAAKTGPTQQQRQLQPRDKKLPESRAVLPPSQSLDEQYLLLSNSGRSQMQQPRVDDSSQLKNRHRHDELSQTIKELRGHLKLQSHSQGVSQSDPSVSMTESSPSQNLCEEPQEKMHHDELQHLKHQKHKKPPRPKENEPIMEVLSPSADQQPQKRGRGRPPKAKLATAATSYAPLPAKCQKQKEQPEKRKQGRPRKLTAKITLAKIKLTLKNQPQQQKRGRGRPRKVTEET